MDVEAMKNSSLNKSVASKTTSDDDDGGDDVEQSEESGWTSYFDDFFSNQIPEDQQCSDICDDHDHQNNNKKKKSSNYFVSDAASFVGDDDHNYYNYNYGKLFLKKDQLIPAEGSSSSPTDNCFLNFSKQLNTRSSTTKGIWYDDSLVDTATSPVNSPKIMQGKGGVPHLQTETQTDKMSGENNTELRKRGLCVAPMTSMLLHYYG